MPAAPPSSVVAITAQPSPPTSSIQDRGPGIPETTPETSPALDTDRQRSPALTGRKPIAAARAQPGADKDLDGLACRPGDVAHPGIM